MATIRELRAIQSRFVATHTAYLNIALGLPLASEVVPDTNFEASLVAEGLFLRYFTLWESSVEAAFLHFCQGGKTLKKTKPICRLANCTSADAKRLLIGPGRFLDWSSAGAVRERASTTFVDGFPFRDPIIGMGQLLADTERIRNLIAHNSAEAWNSYLIVQRNCFGTERTFEMPAGQLLRVRRQNRPDRWATHYFLETAKIFNAIVNG